MVDVVLLVFDRHQHLTYVWGLGIQSDGRHGQLFIVRTPGNRLAVRAEARAAAWYVQVDNPLAVRLDEQDGVAQPHASMHRRGYPLPIGGEARIVEMMQRRAVGVGRDSPRGYWWLTSRRVRR